MRSAVNEIPCNRSSAKVRPQYRTTTLINRREYSEFSGKTTSSSEVINEPKFRRIECIESNCVGFWRSMQKRARFCLYRCENTARAFRLKNVQTSNISLSARSSISLKISHNTRSFRSSMPVAVVLMHLRFDELDIFSAGATFTVSMRNLLYLYRSK